MSDPSHKLSQLSQLPVFYHSVARSEFVLVTTFARGEHSLGGLMRSLYHEAARNGLISKFPTDLAVRLLAHQLVIHSQAKTCVCYETTCALRLQSKDSPCRSRTSPAFDATDSPLAPVGVKSTPLDTYDRKIG